MVAGADAGAARQQKSAEKSDLKKAPAATGGDSNTRGCEPRQK